jgi:hypothetical protein
LTSRGKEKISFEETECRTLDIGNEEMEEYGEDREARAATDLVRILFGKVEEQRLALKAKGRNLTRLGAADAGNAFSNETELKSVRQKKWKRETKKCAGESMVCKCHPRK